MFPNFRLKDIESKLDNLKGTENTILTRHDYRRHSLPGRISTLSNLSNATNLREDENNITPTPTGENNLDDNLQNESDSNLEEGRSNCSTPTFMEINPKLKVY